MVQQLRVQTILAETPNLGAFYIKMFTDFYNSSSNGHDILFWTTLTPAHIQTQTHTYANN